MRELVFFLSPLPIPPPSHFFYSFRSELTVGSILFSFSRSHFGLTHFVCLSGWQFLSVCLSLSVFILLLWRKKNENDWDLASYCPLPQSVWQLLSMCRWKHIYFFTHFWFSFELSTKICFLHTGSIFDLNECSLITYFRFWMVFVLVWKMHIFTSIWTRVISSVNLLEFELSFVILSFVICHFSRNTFLNAFDDWVREIQCEFCLLIFMYSLLVARNCVSFL